MTNQKSSVRAVLRFARITPRKARLVANTVRGLPVEAARVRLQMTDRRAGALLVKLLNSAVANATNNFKFEEKRLRVSNVLVNEGPRLKRFMPRARGSADRMVKRTSHITILLSSETPAAVAKAAPEIETKRIEELRPEDLRGDKAAGRSARDQAGKQKAVKPPEPPRGIRRLLQRKHGGT